MLPVIRKRVADKLKILREKAGLSRQEVADSIGLSLSSVRFYEEGAREPALETLDKLATLFNTTVWFLLLPPGEEREAHALLEALEALPPDRRQKVFEYIKEQAALAMVQIPEF